MRSPRFVIVLFLLLLGCAAAGFGAKLRQVAMIDLPGDPGFDQVAVANGQVVITRPATNTIEIFSPVKRRVIARISHISNPRGLAVDDPGQRLYVALAGSSHIAVINSKTWQVEKMLRVAHRPVKLLWVPETKTLYATSQLDRCVSIVDPERGEETTIELKALPEDMIYDSARQALLVSLQDVAEVAAIDGSHEVTGHFKLVASAPTGLALDSAHRRLYVAVRYAVVVLDADTGTEILRIPAPGGTNALVLDPGGKLLYAATGDGSVLAIDLTRNVVDHELPTDVKGYTLAYEPGHKMLYMPGGREGRSKMLILSPVIGDANATQSAQNAPAKEPTTNK
ncbi:MAG TPA: YncE family protein [Candidatus Angelobacter sp.]|nr:YncE family protein [Candidatus Angelobacter sp.]